MSFIIAIFFGSCWMFIIAICFGFQNVEGILNFIGIFWVVFIVGCVIHSLSKSAKEKEENLDDLQIASFKDGKAKALSIIEKLKWTPTGSMQSREKRYVTFRYSQNDINDFDWLVKYISHSGYHSDLFDSNYSHNEYTAQAILENPYAVMATTIGDSLFKCTKVNADYTTNEIYRFPKSDAENRKIVEGRYAQYTLTEIKEKAEEVKAIEEHETILLEADNSNNESSNLHEEQRAIDILNMQLWEKLNILDKGRVQYVCRKEHAPNPDEFKWVVGYLSGTGTPENPKNPHSYVITKLDGIEYKSIKVNKYFEGTVIYKIGEIAEVKDEMQVLEPTEKLRLSIKKIKLETRFKNHPVAQQNMQLINERKVELKQKKEEYLKLRNRN